MAMTQPVAGGLAGVGAVLRARGLDQFRVVLVAGGRVHEEPAVRPAACRVVEVRVAPCRRHISAGRATGWIKLGLSKGYARSNGRFTAWCTRCARGRGSGWRIRRVPGGEGELRAGLGRRHCSTRLLQALPPLRWDVFTARVGGASTRTPSELVGVALGAATGGPAGGKRIRGADRLTSGRQMVDPRSPRSSGVRPPCPRGGARSARPGQLRAP